MLRQPPTLAIALLLPLTTVSGQVRHSTPMDAVVSALVFTAEMPKNLTPFSAPLAAQIADYQARAGAYHTKTRPLPSSDFAMVYSAWEVAERRLVAISHDPQAVALAQAYVEEARPAYEWEGYHDGPAADAIAAERYLKANPTGPFAEFLQLFAGHRWICAADAYEYEKRPADAARSREASAEHIRLARSSTNALIRSAADRIAQRPQCF